MRFIFISDAASSWKLCWLLSITLFFLYTLLNELSMNWSLSYSNVYVFIKLGFSQFVLNFRQQNEWNLGNISEESYRLFTEFGNHLFEREEKTNKWISIDTMNQTNVINSQLFGIHGTHIDLRCISQSL